MPLVTIYVLFALAQFFWGALLASEARTQSESRDSARMALAAPLWPILLVWYIGLGFAWVVGQAKS